MGEEFEVKGYGVDCFNYVNENGSKEYAGETVLDLIDVDYLINECGVTQFTSYRRHKRDCPFARGNCIIDFMDYDDDTVLCLKFPYQWTDDNMLDAMVGLHDKFVSIFGDKGLK